MKLLEHMIFYIIISQFWPEFRILYLALAMLLVLPFLHLLCSLTPDQSTEVTTINWYKWPSGIYYCFCQYTFWPWPSYFNKNTVEIWITEQDLFLNRPKMDSLLYSGPFNICADEPAYYRLHFWPPSCIDCSTFRSVNQIVNTKWWSDHSISGPVNEGLTNHLITWSLFVPKVNVLCLWIPTVLILCWLLLSVCVIRTLSLG
jgi:hypothetical protein